MARLITDITNSKNDNPSVYPRGYTPDASGSVAGATGGEAAFGDMIQFFSKLMADTSPAITPNSLPDNETNGYQLFQAFINYVRNVLTATETAKGTVEKATSAEALAGTPDKFIDAALLNTFVGGLRTKIVDIGTWNMDASFDVNVSPGITLSKIRGWEAIVQNDAQDTLFTINGNILGANDGADLGAGYLNASGLNIWRRTGGTFDNVLFTSTSINRGWVIFKYVN